jgi:mannose-6-phosphate isomerase-like protein (cupin superfamily)
MHVDDDPPFAVGPGDTVRIPAHCKQQVTNIGDVDLLFLCVCVPGFTPACYQSCE